VRARTARPLPFVLAAAETGPMIVSYLDYNMVSSGAYGVGSQILTRGAYDPEEIALVLDILDQLRVDRGDSIVAFDVGANIGVHTLAMAGHMTGWGNVVAIEPQERIYYALCGNIALSNLFNASAILGLVGAVSGFVGVPQANFTRHGSYGSVEMRFSPSAEFIGQTISYDARNLKLTQKYSIDELTIRSNGRVDFLKIDVEGMELDVLEGAKEAIEKFRPVILAEWIKSGQKPIDDFLLPLNYETSRVSANVLAKPKGS